jgi:hypothetical protein
MKIYVEVYIFLQNNPNPYGISKKTCKESPDPVIIGPMKSMRKKIHPVAKQRGSEVRELQFGAPGARFKITPSETGGRLQNGPLTHTATPENIHMCWSYFLGSLNQTISTAIALNAANEAELRKN